MESPLLFLNLEALEERRKKIPSLTYINPRSFLSDGITQHNALTNNSDALNIGYSLKC